MSNCSQWDLIIEWYDRSKFKTNYVNRQEGKNEKKIDIITSDIIDKIPTVIHKISDQKRYTCIVNIENIRKTESEKENALWNNRRIESVIVV